MDVNPSIALWSESWRVHVDAKDGDHSLLQWVGHYRAIALTLFLTLGVKHSLDATEAVGQLRSRRC